MTDTQSSKSVSVYIIAGEASGDFIGANLMRSLKKNSTGAISFHGIGGDKMAAEGLESLFPHYELSMMGFVEILPYMFNISVRIRQTIDDIIAKTPDILITIDSPGFCFRVVERLRKEKLHSRFIHYVAPRFGPISRSAPPNVLNCSTTC